MHLVVSEPNANVVHITKVVREMGRVVRDHNQ